MIFNSSYLNNIKNIDGLVNENYINDLFNTDSDGFDTFISKGESVLNELCSDLITYTNNAYAIYTESVIAYTMNTLDFEVLYTINENIFMTVIDKIGTLFKSMYSLVKNIIVKIKKDVSLSTKNNDKWLDAVKPILNDKKSSDMSKFVYTGAPWKVSNITKHSFELKNIDSINGCIQDVSEVLDLVGNYDGYKEGSNTFGNQLKSIFKTIPYSRLKDRNETESIELSMDEIFGEKTVEKYLEKISTELKGNDNKIEITGFSKVSLSDMLDTIEGLSAYLQNCSDKYSKVENSLNKAIREYENKKEKISKFNKDSLDSLKKSTGVMRNPETNKFMSKETEEKYKSEAMDKKDEIIKLIDSVILITKTTLNWNNRETALRKKLAEEQCGEYKTIITRYAKSKK